ncbi:ABC transporter ATP-binding protein [Bacillus sp. JCM 19034]|uniref:ABC transporter ATP-binding protein n=1 Tax=Bacillus sp. JCM 19034 TaxID=1481928 RepID=UPI0007835A58|nr:ABC transporter ATP-binding protein [Bacillus sp. JCM 19034]
MHKSAIEVKDIKKSLQDRDILKGISFEVEQGDIFGFIGPNGAGKTTTIRILLGLYKYDSGSATIMGRDVADDEARKKVGFVIDGDGLYDNMTAIANLEYYQMIYEKSVDKKKIGKVLELVGLADRARDKAQTFSKGMRQRLALARALVHDPEVLILDEPTSGIDPTAQLDIRKILLDIVQNEKKTVFFSSHNMDEVQKICNRIALLDKGEIKLYGHLEELRKQMGKNVLTVQTSSEINQDSLDEIKQKKDFGFYKIQDGNLLFTPSISVKTSDIINQLVKVGIEVDEVAKKESSLEEMYNNIVREAEDK